MHVAVVVMTHSQRRSPYLAQKLFERLVFLEISSKSVKRILFGDHERDRQGDKSLGLTQFDRLHEVVFVVQKCPEVFHLVLIGVLQLTVP